MSSRKKGKRVRAGRVVDNWMEDVEITTDNQGFPVYTWPEESEDDEDGEDEGEMGDALVVEQ